MISNNKIFQGESLVSFVLVAYNQDAFIREAVEGALSQSYSPLEIILSDDCSTDETFEIMQEISAAYEGPHHIILNRNDRNLGLGNHLNRVFGMCSGQLMVIAAGDDISLTTRTASLYQSWIESGKPSMICSGWNAIDRSGRPLSDAAESRKISVGLLGAGNNVRTIQDYLNGKSFSLVGATAAYSQALIHSFPALGKDIVSEDFALCLRALLLSDVFCIENALVLYRQHDRNVSNVDGSGAERFRIWSIRHAPTFEGLYRDLKRAFGLSLLSLSDFIRLGLQAKAWVKSASILEKWNRANFLTKLLWLFPGLMLWGSYRHKKFAMNNLLKAHR